MKREGIISFRQARRAECFEVTGVVQGVGFRPFVWRRATQLGLCGQIRNLGDRVEILAAGQESALNHLEKALQIGPPHARVDCVIRKEIPDKGWHDFTIVESAKGAENGKESGIVADLVVCQACLAESRAITGRRAGYALTNCTHCGPRFSIVTGFPYDRAQTTMAPFGMCLACRAEYTNPADRRFHAQAIACPACGPLLTYLDQDGQNFTQEKALSYAAQRLRAGGVLAMKGIGGYHLACLATQADSIQQLRVIKHRPFQPLAVMMRDVAMVAHYCRMNEAEQNLLNSAAAPIVLLQPLKHNILPNNLAPGVARWGVMLPYTPLHALLLEAVGAPLVMSSGNVSGSPQIIDDAEALKLLAPRGEGCLMHNRKIARRLDDSLVHYVAGQRMTLRRGRGLVPEWFCLPQGLENAPSVLAVGADTKAAFCLTRGGKALLSQHLGNLNDVAGKEGFLTALRDYQTLFQYNNPCILAHDAHPDYVSTRLAQELVQEWGEHLQPIWHHHAHIVACMAEHGFDILTSSINQKRDHQHRVGVGIALDGTGLGPDGTFWGGEVLLCDYVHFKRKARLAPIVLLGGDKAIREPWRVLIASLERFVSQQKIEVALRSGVLPAYNGKPLSLLRSLLQDIESQKKNAPLCSSAGRLFDAVAALLGVAPHVLTYEGEAAMRLEALATSASEKADVKPFSIIQRIKCSSQQHAQQEETIIDQTCSGWDPLWEIDPTPFWESCLDHLIRGTPASSLALAFHYRLAEALIAVTTPLVRSIGGKCVFLGGGVAHNKLLTEALYQGFAKQGIHLYKPSHIPAGDGGLAFGQAVIAAATITGSGKTAV